jgi:hypothetical protein
MPKNSLNYKKFRELKQCDSKLKASETICDLIDLYKDTGHLTEEEEKLDDILSNPSIPTPELP